MKRELLIKFGEIFLKGDNRRKFEISLLDNIKHKISKFGNFNIKQMGSVYSICGENVQNLLCEIEKIFGISSFSLSWCVGKNIDEIKKACDEELSNLNVNSFKVEAKRSDKKFALNSLQICNEIGDFISKKYNLKVDVHNPDVIVHIEIRNDSYVYCKNHKGLGGLPVGTSGLGTVMISGGIDSPVASFMMCKRGLKLQSVHFSTPPYTSLRSVEKVKRILKVISQYSGKIKFFNVNFCDIQQNIKKNCSEDLTTIISRRFMYKISEKICFSEGSSCLITGESLGQVASQTVSAINCTSHSVQIPIFRPLIGLDKEEITRISKKIGTFDISIENFEDCCSLFSPKNPRINPILKFVENDERKLENIDQMVEDAVNNAEICIIGE